MMNDNNRACLDPPLPLPLGRSPSLLYSSALGPIISPDLRYTIKRSALNCHTKCLPNRLPLSLFLRREKAHQTKLITIGSLPCPAFFVLSWRKPETRRKLQSLSSSRLVSSRVLSKLILFLFYFILFHFISFFAIFFFSFAGKLTSIFFALFAFPMIMRRL